MGNVSTSLPLARILIGNLYVMKVSKILLSIFFIKSLKEYFAYHTYTDQFSYSHALSPPSRNSTAIHPLIIPWHNITFYKAGEALLLHFT